MNQHLTLDLGVDGFKHKKNTLQITRYTASSSTRTQQSCPANPWVIFRARLSVSLHLARSESSQQWCGSGRRGHREARPGKRVSCLVSQNKRRFIADNRMESGTTPVPFRGRPDRH